MNRERNLWPPDALTFRWRMKGEDPWGSGIRRQHVLPLDKTVEINAEGVRYLGAVWTVKMVVTVSW